MMLIEVKVVPKASRNVIKVEGGRLRACVTAPPERGKANQALIKLLASHFRVRKTDITIVRGEHAPLKTLRIETTHESSPHLKKT